MNFCFKIGFQHFLWLWTLLFSSLVYGESHKLVHVDSTTGEAYEWSVITGWKKAELQSLIDSFDPQKDRKSTRLNSSH